MTRPPDLPEFGNPPLNEVVLGVQFDTPAGYQQIRAGEVWKLFSAEFPQVQELPSLPPAFETFGPQGSMIGFAPVFGPLHGRFWFMSASGNELIQFQNDRLLHNWRKVTSSDSPYPRYDYIASKFSDELHALEGFMSGLQTQTLRIRQCEISYINHIKPNAGEDSNIGAWLNFMSFTNEPDDFLVSFRRIIKSASGKLLGRLMCEGATAIEPTGQHFISLNLTARGAPEQPSLQSALEFVDRGREIICRTFAEITTDESMQSCGVHYAINAAA